MSVCVSMCIHVQCTYIARLLSLTVCVCICVCESVYMSVCVSMCIHVQCTYIARLLSLTVCVCFHCLVEFEVSFIPSQEPYSIPG
jgi:hypothetical protein